MTKAPLLPVILCGGGGTRLAPLSTLERPKQFLDLFEKNPRSLFQRTLSRLPRGADVLDPLIVGNIRHRDLIRGQIADAGIAEATIIHEPANRNTAPAIATAAHWAASYIPDATLVVMPSDHVVEDALAFRDDVLQARQIAAKGYIVVFGVDPHRVETGYGYIQPGKEIATSGTPAFKVDGFLEKPDLATARQYLHEGTTFWNSGIFVFRPETLLAEFQRLAPEINTGSGAALQETIGSDQGLRLPLAGYEKLQSISLDYAIMEKTTIAAMMRFSSPWWDLGTTETLQAFSTSPHAVADPLSPTVLEFLNRRS